MKAVEAYHPCHQYPNKNRIIIGFCFLCIKKSLEIFIHCGCKERNSYCNPSYAPPNVSNVRIRRRQITKNYSNGNPIMKIYFQVNFDFTWYATSAFTVRKQACFLLFWSYFRALSSQYFRRLSIHGEKHYKIIALCPSIHGLCYFLCEQIFIIHRKCQRSLI